MNLVVIFNNGVFRIFIVVQLDEGEYYCKGINVVGMFEIRIILFV